LLPGLCGQASGGSYEISASTFHSQIAVLASSARDPLRPAHSSSSWEVGLLRLIRPAHLMERSRDRPCDLRRRCRKQSRHGQCDTVAGFDLSKGSQTIKRGHYGIGTCHNSIGCVDVAFRWSRILVLGTACVRVFDIICAAIGVNSP
jgi:hypothetical protein